MSKWRLKGFVQDSDDDEEDLETATEHSNHDSQRENHNHRPDDETTEANVVPCDRKAGIDHVKTSRSNPNAAEGWKLSPLVKPNDVISTGSVTITSHFTASAPSSRVPSMSPRGSAIQLPKSYAESPDPLLARMSPLSKGIEQFPTSSQTLGEPGFPSATIDSHGKSNDVGVTSNRFLQELGIGPLSDTSDSDVLSDPPSDLDESLDQTTVFTQPARRTAVQVVIPRSSAAHEEFTEGAAARSLRERKPIQLHPYALEGELYRRELQGRGIKPVRLQRSPPRTSRHDVETQEQEFDPNGELLASSPIDDTVSTPAPRRLIQESRQTIGRTHSKLKRHVAASTFHVSPSSKRRRFGRISTPAAVQETKAPGRYPEPSDVWAIPRSPPRSSSPWEVSKHSGHRDLVHYPAPKPNGILSTPSQSSSLQSDVQPLTESGLEPILRSARRSTGRRRRPIVILDDSSSTASQESGCENNVSEFEMRLARKKTKGVLPASWIAIDAKAQTMRYLGAKERPYHMPSSDANEYPRGIARRVMKRSTQGTKNVEHGSNEAVEISDESVDEHRGSNDRSTPVLESAQEAVDTAAVFDSPYAGDDSDDMEDDVLPLFPLHGQTRKREKQAKLTKGLSIHKKPKSTANNARLHGIAKPFVRDKQGPKPRRELRASPPALSVLDFDTSSLNDQIGVPSFLKIAQRQARQRADFARQRPTNKSVMLQTGIDTGDANNTLQKWKRGELQPRYPRSRPEKLPAGRTPLTAIQDTQRRHIVAVKSSRALVESNMPATMSTGRSRNRQRFSRGCVTFPHPHKSLGGPRTQKAVLTLTKSHHRQPSHTKNDVFRPAQLEGMEGSHRTTDRKATFHLGLQEVNRQYELQAPLTQPLRNPQLARFLANGPAALSIDSDKPSVPTQVSLSPRRRPARKVEAQRLDVDTRAYRQPTEPALADVFIEPPPALLPASGQGQGHEQSALQGLGPHGTKYPTTFDVSPLKPDTYFHASTFIGGSELKRALSSSCADARELDHTAGFVTLSHRGKSMRCGPWNDEVFSFMADTIADIWHQLDNEITNGADRTKVLGVVATDTADLLRSIINYISTHLSFLDPIDRQMFATKFKQLGETLFEQMLTTSLTINEQNTNAPSKFTLVRVTTYLLVIFVQALQISQHPVVASTTRQELEKLIANISRFLVSRLLSAISQICAFLERNKQFKERELGVQSSDILVESTVVCMNTLAIANVPRASFWDSVSQELATQVGQASDVKAFESLWGALFALLPFIEVDDSGIIDSGRRTSFQQDNWVFVRDTLRRLFDMYSCTYRLRSLSLNDYVRATLTRCHHLIQFWHWKRCEHALSTTFDFFASNGLRNLRREKGSCSVQFLEDFEDKQALNVVPGDVAFHIFLKCIALALQGMKESYPERKIQSIVSRLTPNHGRSYPKDQPMETESRDALRNHLDLLCTLYYASPPSCRPRLDMLRDLVQHETSHREACRLSVRAWSILTTFQMSTDEPYVSAKPLSEWLKEIIRETLKQYHLAKTEAEKYLNTTSVEKTDVSSIMARQTMEKNQEQVIATLRHCTAGVQRVIGISTNQATLRDFLVDSGLAELLKLPHFEDARLVFVIRDILHIFRSYTTMPKPETRPRPQDSTAEESQDLYGGESLDIELWFALEQQTDVVPTEPPLDFIQAPLWNLLSNAFGAGSAPDDNLLMDCVDTWALIASQQVLSGARTWSHYLSPHGSVSWSQLSQTEQTQKFSPYFMAAVISNDSSVYSSHRLEFLNALLLSLADREATLRHQHRLLQALVRVAPTDPLLDNLPFFKNGQTGEFDISSETLRARRLVLISSILANIRKDFHKTIQQDASQVAEVRENYAAILRGFMTAMKDRYLQLHQNTMVAGAYVEFVQKIVQYLQQYTADICPVIDFFTDSAAFPLPATDPTYVIGRLRGYAPKLAKTGISKQLSVFVQTVVQQAAAGNQQAYLINQLITALRTEESTSKDQTVLRNVMLQGILPAYIESALGSVVGLLIAKPILQSLPRLLDAAFFDVRVFDKASVDAADETVLSIFHAFVRGTEQLQSDMLLFRQPHLLSAMTLFLNAMVAMTKLSDYTNGRCSTWIRKPVMVTHVENFTSFIFQLLSGMLPQHMPSYVGDAHASNGPYADLSSFCAESLAASIKTNWSTVDGCIFFGQGNAKRRVIFDLGSLEEERGRLVEAYATFNETVANTYGEDCMGGRSEQRKDFSWDVDV